MQPGPRTQRGLVPCQTRFSRHEPTVNTANTPMNDASTAQIWRGFKIKWVCTQSSTTHHHGGLQVSIQGKDYPISNICLFFLRFSISIIAYGPIHPSCTWFLDVLMCWEYFGVLNPIFLMHALWASISWWHDSLPWKMRAEYLFYIPNVHLLCDTLIPVISSLVARGAGLHWCPWPVPWVVFYFLVQRTLFLFTCRHCLVLLDII